MNDAHDHQGAPAKASVSRVLLQTGLLAFFGYLCIAWGVTAFYPFSTFPMYSDIKIDSASRVVARTADGKLHDPTSYPAWDCAQPLDVSFQHCMPYMRYYYIPYIDLQLAKYVDSHPAHLPRGETVDLVRHIWRLDPGHEREEDCVLQRCRAGAP